MKEVLFWGLTIYNCKGYLSEIAKTYYQTIDIKVKDYSLNAQRIDWEKVISLTWTFLIISRWIALVSLNI